MMLLPGPRLLLIGGVIGAGLVALTVSGRLRNSESHSEHLAIAHTMESEGWWSGFIASWSMILVSEIGDKTFFIACLMAMRHPRATVFAGAIAALAVQTVLSSAMGSIVPQLLPPYYTQLAAVVLFFGFGGKLLHEARTAEDEEGEPEELQEAADEIRKKDEEYGDGGSSPVAADPEGGVTRRDVGSEPGPRGDPVVDVQRKTTRKNHGMAVGLFGPIFVQAFTLTFIAEWGDRSQLATIALAAAKNPFGVCIGGIVGHSICTGAAVLLGQKVANMLSPRQVTFIGGVLFIVFGALTAYQLMYPEGIGAGHGLPPADVAEVSHVIRELDKGDHDSASKVAARAVALIERLAKHAVQAGATAKPPSH